MSRPLAADILPFAQDIAERVDHLRVWPSPPVRFRSIRSFAAATPRDRLLLRGLPKRDLAAIAEFGNLFPRHGAARVREVAEELGLLDRMARLGRFSLEALVSDAQEHALSTTGFRHTLFTTVLAVLHEAGMVVKDGGAYTWTGKWRLPGLAAREERWLRTHFAGTMAWYDACGEHAAPMLRGGEQPMDFGPYWAGVWDGILGAPEQVVRRRLCLRAMGLTGSRGRVLDLCYGTGGTTESILREAPEARVTCLDGFDSGQPHAMARLKALGDELGRPLDVEFVPATWWTREGAHGFDAPLPFEDGTFDAVFFPMNEGFLTPEQRAPLYQEFARVLRPGGTLGVVSACQPDPARQPRSLRIHVLTHQFHELSVKGFVALPTRDELYGAAAEAGLPSRLGDAGGFHGLLHVFGKGA